MKPFNGYKPQEIQQAPSALPAGGYVCKILSAEIVNQPNRNGGIVEKLVIKFDIYEGVHTEHFKQQYETSTFADKKWKGVHRLDVPDEASEYAERQIKTFNNFIYCIEASNTNYHWAWEEKTLAGKYVGLIFRNKEWEMDTQAGHKTGWTTEPALVTTVDRIRSGDYKIPADKPLNGTATASAATAETFAQVSEDDLPF